MKYFIGTGYTGCYICACCESGLLTIRDCEIFAEYPAGIRALSECGAYINVLAMPPTNMDRSLSTAINGWTFSIMFLYATIRVSHNIGFKITEADTRPYLIHVFRSESTIYFRLTRIRLTRPTLKGQSPRVIFQSHNFSCYVIE